MLFIESSLQYSMKRNSIRKASTFKLQAARARYAKFLQVVEASVIATLYPSLTQLIRESTYSIYDMCYTFKDESPFLRGLNYDEKSFGFSSLDSTYTYREYLGDVEEAYLLGEFNSYDEKSHPLTKVGEMFTIELDTNVLHLCDGAKLLLKVVKAGNNYYLPPPSCHVNNSQTQEGIPLGTQEGIPLGTQEGILLRSKAVNSITSKSNNLLGYTIDLKEIPLHACLEFIEKEQSTLECFNTVILRNLFTDTASILHRYSLGYKEAETLSQIVSKLGEYGIRTVLEWDFQCKERTPNNPIEAVYIKNNQFDFQNEHVMAFYLSNISCFYKAFGIGGMHFTNVQDIYDHPNGVVLLKCITLLTERLNQHTITLASSSQYIPGICHPILEGGFGFTFAYHQNAHIPQCIADSTLLTNIDMINTLSNTIALDLTPLTPAHHLSLLLACILTPRGIVTSGNFQQMKEQLQKILKLRKQEELFRDFAEIVENNRTVLCIKRGANYILFNSGDKQEEISVGDNLKLVFNDKEQNVRVGTNNVVLTSMNCVFLEAAQKI